MSRKHAVVVALALAVAVAMGLVALARTTRAGSAAHAAGAVSSASIVKRSHTLDRLEASLRRSLANQPPKLPAVPAFRKPAQGPSPQPAAAGAAAPTAPAAPRVVYVRPAPIVVHRHAGGEHERERETGEREGQGLDD
jgi:hypothetical protein